MDHRKVVCKDRMRKDREGRENIEEEGEKIDRKIVRKEKSITTTKKQIDKSLFCYSFQVPRLLKLRRRAQ